MQEKKKCVIQPKVGLTVRVTATGKKEKQNKTQEDHETQQWNSKAESNEKTNNDRLAPGRLGTTETIQSSF